VNTRSSFSRFCHSSIPRLAVVTLVVLALSSLVSCSRKNETNTGSHSKNSGIHDAALNGDLAKVKALLKTNPDLVFSKDSQGDTPLLHAAEYGHK